MRCPRCAGQIPDGSIFCGICGRQIGGGEHASQRMPPSEPMPAHSRGLSPALSAAARSAPQQSLSPSLFELPVSRNARLIKLFAVLALDLVLIGAGIAMIFAYLSARERATQTPAVAAEPDAESASVVIGPPMVATPSATALPHPPSAPTTGTATGRDRDPAGAPKTGDGRKSTTAAERSAGTTTETKGGSRRPAPTPATRSNSRTPSTSADSLGTAPASPTSSTPRVEPEPESAPAAAAGADAGTQEPPAADPERDARMKLLTHRVALVVDKNRPQFQRCYRQVAKASGPVQGKVVIRFKVKADGQAINVRASSNETQSERLAQCLVAQFSSWSFPSHSEPQAIDFMWPIVFKTSD